MLQLNFIRENPELVCKRLLVKHFEAEELVREIMELDTKRRETQKNLDDLLAESNALAKEIGKLFQTGRTAEANQLKQSTAEKKELSRRLSETLDMIQQDIHDKLVLLPNLPHTSVPAGRHAEDNEIIETHGKLPAAGENLSPHWELTTKYKLIDFEAGSKITGAGFPVYTGQGARLQRALINFFIDEAVKAGYQEIQPPYLVNEASAFGTGQLPDKDGQMYLAGLDQLYLIPTAEVPVTNLYRDVLLKMSDLPIRNVAYSACFRREAGSYGKDVRGLNRLHQFDKVEIVQITQPSLSYDSLREMTAHVTGLLHKLELPFRIVRLCGGDMSFASALTYDFEVFAGGQQRWLEVSSVSNFENFQSNRMKLRFKNEEGKTGLAHTLNGSALALPRIVAGLLENHQHANGIRIPEALIPYTGFDTIKA
ncbi:MAG TPA: serine--tRNA ligase [Bacteroidales bacterium]|nr:serine--tRNA ligase [Bacteroidales bacterium]HSA42980.1 serine--tRNA ligase [Bacteroidales bacterium]